MVNIIHNNASWGIIHAGQRKQGFALGSALQSNKPAVLDCRTRFVPHPCMPGFGSMNRYGFDALTHPSEA